MYSAAIIEHAARDVGEAIFFFGAVAGIIATLVILLVIHLIRKPFRSHNQEAS
jgi:hypothetical protein